MQKKYYFIVLVWLFLQSLQVVRAQTQDHLCAPSGESSIFLRSLKEYNGLASWKIRKCSEVKEDGSAISKAGYNAVGWLPAIVPGTVLNSLVSNGIYPEPYFGDNNRKSLKLIPDIADAGREFYHYWFRSEFDIPANFAGKRIWLKFHGINYRCDIWVNGTKIGEMAGMFNTQSYDITKAANSKGKNVIAVNVQPVDYPGTTKLKGKQIGAVGENQNGGNGEIGKNVSMLMSVGWDFTSPDGIRDRNTGIWRDVELYATGEVVLENPFVQTRLPLPDTTMSYQTISVEVFNSTDKPQKGTLQGFIRENKVAFEKKIVLAPHERKTVVCNSSEFKQLVFKNPLLWWPVNKGKQNLYTLDLKFSNDSKVLSLSIETRFGVRQITSDQNTPDKSRRFLVNGVPVFVRGTNWVPEAMVRNNEERTFAELKYTRQAGLNFIRLWGGGIAESDYFYKLCDEFGFLVWNEFWMT
ncbi:MAG TPA: beta galactosidase jelly roll domain-containing protein, partial [Bacteroidales bacterium]|nr:beta galactosidase jelly roll domain-containing protein [Bacteroidales bacterium]